MSSTAGGALLPPHPFAGRRHAALERLDGGSMVLPAAPVRFKSGDSEYRYRPDSELFYLTGWDAADCVAVLRSFANERRFVLFVPERDEKRELWDGPRPGLAEAREKLGADAVLPLADLGAHAPGLLADGGPIHYRLGASAACDGVVREALRRGRARRARKGAGARAVVDPGAVLDDMRLRKDEAEVARIRAAARITVAAFAEALGRVRAGVGEWEVEAALEAGFRSRGANGPAFATIVAAGANACTLHYTANASRIGPGDLVLVDAGAEVGWYAADVTRTVAAGVDGARAEAHAIVRRARREALAACAPGASVDAPHDAASRAIAAGLAELGVVGGSVDDILDRGDQKPFFPHRTSHWLGLDTHDVGDYKCGAEPVRLEPGMVLTVEPGLYFRPGSCAQVPELEGTGIRIEDDVLITAEGAEVLTGDLPVRIGGPGSPVAAPSTADPRQPAQRAATSGGSAPPDDPAW